MSKKVYVHKRRAHGFDAGKKTWCGATTGIDWWGTKYLWHEVTCPECLKGSPEAKRLRPRCKSCGQKLKT